MSGESFTPRQRMIGRVAAWSVFSILVIYAVTLTLGLLSLQSPADPIGDPYFSLMEILIVLLVPALVVSMAAIHVYAAPVSKLYSLTALALMLPLATITASVHFVILTVSRQIQAADLPGTALFLSFTWPSVIYTLDILAWDFFFALAMLFAAPVFAGSRLATTVRYLFVASGLLSLTGLIGVPLADMQIRNIGIIGYVPVAAIAFLLLGIMFGRTPQTAREPSRKLKAHAAV